MRGRRGPVLPSFHPAKNKVQQRVMNWIRAMVLWVRSNSEGGVALLTVPLMSFVMLAVVKGGVASMFESITIDLEMEWRGFWTTKQGSSSISSSALGKDIKSMESIFNFGGSGKSEFGNWQRTYVPWPWAIFVQLQNFKLANLCSIGTMKCNRSPMHYEWHLPSSREQHPQPFFVLHYP